NFIQQDVLLQQHILVLPFLHQTPVRNTRRLFATARYQQLEQLVQLLCFLLHAGVDAKRAFGGGGHLVLIRPSGLRGGGGGRRGGGGTLFLLWICCRVQMKGDGVELTCAQGIDKV